MITLKDFMEVVDYRISEGDRYGWNCYGPNAYQMSFWNGIHGKGGWSLNVVFDTRDQTVYEAEVCDYSHDRAYRLINPNYKSDFNAEVDSRGEWASEAWDGVNYIDLETDEDFLEKAHAIVKEQYYDIRVSVPMNFTDEELFEYMKLAHEKDITLNQLVEEALRLAIEQEKLTKLKKEENNEFSADGC